MPADATIDVQKILLPVLITAGAAYVHQLWKYNRDAYEARVDETCKLIFELADRAADYWYSPKHPPHNKRSPAGDAPASADHQRLGFAEVQIDGRLKELQFLRLMLQSRFNLSDKGTLIDLMASFQDALTGGDFGSHARAADHQRASQIYVAASDLVSHLRNGAERGNRLWVILVRKLESILPYRRPTTRAGKLQEAFLLCPSIGCFLVGGALCLVGFWNWLAQQSIY